MKANVFKPKALNTTATQGKADAFCEEILYHLQSPKRKRI